MLFQYSYKHIDPEKYITLFSDPLWYLKLIPEFKEYFWDYQGGLSGKPETWLLKRAEITRVVSEAFESGALKLAEEGRDWDRKRMPIDTVVVHHTQTEAGTAFSVLDALHLIRLYIPAHLREGESQFQTPLWSNHFYNNKQTFIGYHYLIHRDGSSENPLKNEYVGWHSGHIPTNLRSIAICFVDNLLERRPTEAALETARKLIQKYQPNRILGHREVKENRTCPGNLFLGEEGWKKELIS